MVSGIVVYELEDIEDGALEECEKELFHYDWYGIGGTYQTFPMVQGSIFKDRAICATLTNSYFNYTVDYDGYWFYESGLCNDTIFPEFVDDEFQKCLVDWIDSDASYIWAVENLRFKIEQEKYDRRVSEIKPLNDTLNALLNDI